MSSLFHEVGGVSLFVDLPARFLRHDVSIQSGLSSVAEGQFHLLQPKKIITYCTPCHSTLTWQIVIFRPKLRSPIIVMSNNNAGEVTMEKQLGIITPQPWALFIVAIFSQAVMVRLVPCTMRMLGDRMQRASRCIG